MLGRRCVELMLGVGLLALGPNAHAYRTAGDLEDFKGTERVAWHSGVTSFVLVDKIPGVVGGVDASLHLAKQALSAWQDVSCTSVIASLKGTTSSRAAYGDGINSIQWVDSGWEELGFRPGASGATDLRYEERDGQWVIAEADVYLNLYAHSWITGIADEDAEDGVAEIVGVMTHELGHALGLLHPCEEGGEPECTKSMTTSPATMYPEYSHGQLTLKEDDIAGICFLYPACDPESCAEGEVCTRNGCAVVCGETTCQVGEVCMEGRCVDWKDPCQVAPDSCVSCESDKDCSAGFECRGEVCAPRTVLPRNRTRHGLCRKPGTLPAHPKLSSRPGRALGPPTQAYLPRSPPNESDENHAKLHPNDQGGSRSRGSDGPQR